FYRKYYQPDDAHLILAGQFDPGKALAMVAETLGSIPRPERVLSQPYTVEPTQEGERSVMLHRIGSTQEIEAVYHIPAALHPDSAPLQVLAQVLGASQTGRLYKDLVDSKKATFAYMGAGSNHDPGVVRVVAALKLDQSVDEAQQILLKTVEGVAANPPTQEEVDRAKTRILKNIDLAMTNSQSVSLMLGGYVGDGDWRLLFLDRDEVSKVTPEDVTRVARTYLKSSNRTLGEFIPVAAPDRAEIPATPDVAARFKDFKGGAAIQEGEAFDPTPKNIEARLVRATLPNGIKLVLFPKKTRGGTVTTTLNVRFGDEKSLFGKSAIADLTGSLLMSGTLHKNRQQIQDETDRLKAQIYAGGGDTYVFGNVHTREANLADSLRFLRELLREPSFPESEFEKVRQQEIASIESGKTEPYTLAHYDLNKNFRARFPRGDLRSEESPDEKIEDLKKATLADVQQFYKQFYGPGEGEIIVSGQFDPAEVKKLAGELFGDWKSASPYTRVREMYAPIPAINHKIETPDKQNAVFLAQMPLKMTDEDPDYAALTIADTIFGGNSNSRLFQRIRVKDGLSYDARSSHSMRTQEDGGWISVSAIAAPQNTPKVEADFNDELAKALKDGFTADEVEKAKKTWLDERAVGRADESSLAYQLSGLERWGRTMQWQANLEATVAALTPQQVNDAFRRHVDPAAFSIVKGGDFKKATVYQ
ncbi:MAG TPA: insulinase family protein, partial [Acidobacteriaceae bacterium]|nr:insulinase family protein [Acidobacteriaceae bacterium]